MSNSFSLTEGHISITVSLKRPVVMELTTIIYATLMLKEHLCDIIMVNRYVAVKGALKLNNFFN